VRGAALIARGDVNRVTEDLDLSSREPATVVVLPPVAVRAIREAGLEVQIVHAAPGFAGLSIEGAVCSYRAGAGLEYTFDCRR
jgi:hypothetical protein